MMGLPTHITCRWFQSYPGLLCSNLHNHQTELNHSLQWRHNERVGVSNHPRLDCLLTRLFYRRSKKKHQSFASLSFVRGIHLRPVDSPNNRPVTRKMVPFDNVIMILFVTWITVLLYTSVKATVNQSDSRVDAARQHRPVNLNIRF